MSVRLTEHSPYACDVENFASFTPAKSIKKHCNEKLKSRTLEGIVDFAKIEMYPFPPKESLNSQCISHGCGTKTQVCKGDIQGYTPEYFYKFLYDIMGRLFDDNSDNPNVIEERLTFMFFLSQMAYSSTTNEASQHVYNEWAHEFDRYNHSPITSHENLKIFHKFYARFQQPFSIPPTSLSVNAHHDLVGMLKQDNTFWGVIQQQKPVWWTIWESIKTQLGKGRIFVVKHNNKYVIFDGKAINSSLKLTKRIEECLDFFKSQKHFGFSNLDLLKNGEIWDKNWLKNEMYKDIIESSDIDKPKITGDFNIHPGLVPYLHYKSFGTVHEHMEPLFHAMPENNHGKRPYYYMYLEKDLRKVLVISIRGTETTSDYITDFIFSKQGFIDEVIEGLHGLLINMNTVIDLPPYTISLFLYALSRVVHKSSTEFEFSDVKHVKSSRMFYRAMDLLENMNKDFYIMSNSSVRDGLRDTCNTAMKERNVNDKFFLQSKFYLPESYFNIDAITDVVLVGHSLGGALANIMALCLSGKWSSVNDVLQRRLTPFANALGTNPTKLPLSKIMNKFTLHKLRIRAYGLSTPIVFSEEYVNNVKEARKKTTRDGVRMFDSYGIYTSDDPVADPRIFYNHKYIGRHEPYATDCNKMLTFKKDSTSEILSKEGKLQPHSMFPYGDLTYMKIGQYYKFCHREGGGAPILDSKDMVRPTLPNPKTPPKTPPPRDTRKYTPPTPPSREKQCDALCDLLSSFLTNQNDPPEQILESVIQSLKTLSDDPKIERANVMLQQMYNIYQRIKKATFNHPQYMISWIIPSIICEVINTMNINLLPYMAELFDKNGSNVYQQIEYYTLNFIDMKTQEYPLWEATKQKLFASDIEKRQKAQVVIDKLTKYELSDLDITRPPPRPRNKELKAKTV